ncbi:RNA-directed DNA polymerase [Stenotrophomonas sp. TWI819]|uniref:RNA-directed DNA polymerase n=1 Tax=Stenotrophomonas sp. TWI819 TaxID=3136800 RepID=UPI00320A4721
MKLHAEFLLLRSAGFKYALRTDISRFFPTIYTHSIPWALHSKSVAKRNRGRQLLGNLLDETSRNLQDGQTIGLPIGPDTSHIIAELITAAIDKELRNELSDDLSGLRYVDDYYLFFRTRKGADNALASLIRLLQEYELQINFEKTRICETVELADDLWTHELRAFQISGKATTQSRDLHYFLEIAKRTAARNTDESVMLYAIKKAASKVIRRENWKSFVAHLCHVAIAYPNTLQQVERILSTYVRIGYPIDRGALGRLANSIIEEHAPLNHHSEVAWCLWMCKSLDLKLSANNVRQASTMRSSVCSLILLDLEQSRKLPIAIDHSVWDHLRGEQHLFGSSWLLCYEAGLRNWGGFQRATVDANPYFNDLAKRDIHFYEPFAQSRPIFTFDKEAAKKAKGDNAEDWLSLLDGDDADEYVDFDDDPNEYGSVSLDDLDDDIGLKEEDKDEDEEEDDMYD